MAEQIIPAQHGWQIIFRECEYVPVIAWLTNGRDTFAVTPFGDYNCLYCTLVAPNGEGTWVNGKKRAVTHGS